MPSQAEHIITKREVHVPNLPGLPPFSVFISSRIRGSISAK